MPDSETAKKLLVYDKCQTIGDFLEWLQYHRDVVLCQWGTIDGEEVLIPTTRSINLWLADYFEIDLDKLEEERQAFLQSLATGVIPIVQMEEEEA